MRSVVLVGEFTDDFQSGTRCSGIKDSSHLDDVSFSKDGVMVSTASRKIFGMQPVTTPVAASEPRWIGPGAMPAFPHHVHGFVFLGTQKQVIGVDTWRKV